MLAPISWLIDSMKFYTVPAIFQPFDDKEEKTVRLIIKNIFNLGALLQRTLKNYAL